jgi:hypothetical protein
MPNITGARSYVEVPAPAPKVGGLYAVARVIDSADPHDLLGAEYETDACTPAQHWSAGNCGYGYPATPCNPTPNPAATNKTFHGTTLVTGDPFTVYDGIDCNLMGAPADHYEGRVRDGLALKEPKQVEAHVAGLLLALDATSTAATSIADAVAQAEGWLAANYEGQGVIHMSRVTAALACAADVVAVGIDGTLATCQGTPIANGAGYGSVLAVGAVIASGQVTIIRGPVDVRSTPGQNVGAACEPPRALAERTFVPLIECGASRYTYTAP